MCIAIYKYLIAIFMALFINGAYAVEIEEHRIAVLVNDQMISSYDISQRAKMNAAINGINISTINRQQFIKSIVDELVAEKLKNEKILEYNISLSDEEYVLAESQFYTNRNINKDELEEIFNNNNLNYLILEKFITTEMSWQKLISSLYYRLTSVTEIEINEIIDKNSNISESQAENIIIQRKLDLKSNKLLRDIFNEATIEYK